MHLCIGVDVGNFDTKTQNTTTPSGYVVHNAKPLMERDCLKYNGKYYAPSFTRIEYIKDKTENDQCLVLTLLGIAKEIMYQAEASTGESYSSNPPTALIEYISSVTSISLGVGLPVGDFNALEPKTKQYYQNKLSGTIQFQYRDIDYSFVVDKIAVFPQDILPVCANENCGIVNDYNKYVIIGIGGQTVDIIPVIKGKPILEMCISDRRGVRNMFSSIISIIDMNYGTTISEDTINELLLGNRTPLPEDMQNAIKNRARMHALELLNICSTKNINYMEYPAVFFGGGALLLKPYIEESPLLQTYEFIDDVNGNAKFYAEYIEKK